MSMSYVNMNSTARVFTKVLRPCSEIAEARCKLAVERLAAIGDQRNLFDAAQSGWIWTSFGVFLPLCLFGIIGNLITIIMFARYIKRTTTSIFIIALAFVDLVVCSVIMPIWFYNLLNQEISSDFVCRLNNFSKYLAVPMSGGILMAIAVDRFLLICLVKTNIMTPLRAKIIILIIMLICTGIAIPQIFSVTTIHPVAAGSCQGELRCDLKICRLADNKQLKEVNYRLWQTNMISFLVMVVLFTLAYMLIFIKVFQIHKTMTKWTQAPAKFDEDELTFASAEETHTGKKDDSKIEPEKVDKSFERKTGAENAILVDNAMPGSPKSPTTAQRKKKKLPHLHTAITLALVTGSFILAYAPMILMMLLGTCESKNEHLGSSCEMNSPQHFIWHFFFINHVMNPIIYSFMNPRFKEALLNLLRGRKRKRES